MDSYRVITVRYLPEARAVALERVARGAEPLLPDSELRAWQRDAGQPWLAGRIRELSHVVNVSGLVLPDEAATYAGYDSHRGIAYFVCAVMP